MYAFEYADCLLENQLTVLPVFWLFEIGRPGVIVDVVGDWFSVVVVRCTGHYRLLL